MTDTLVLNAKTRSDIGKGASRRLRREQNLIPAVVYGTDKPATSLTFDHNKVIKFLESEAVYSSILTINIDGTPEQVVLKDLQRHPFKPKVLHMDFMRIDANAKIHMNVPLHFTNQDKAPGCNKYWSKSQLRGTVIANTNITAAPKPTAVDTFLDTAR